VKAAIHGLPTVCNDGRKTGYLTPDGKLASPGNSPSEEPSSWILGGGTSCNLSMVKMQTNQLLKITDKKRTNLIRKMGNKGMTQIWSQGS